ncbi:MAG: hypothetical protein O3B17_04885 [Actinomycetota bacterium]|nr:hypothetical protein [Actinomycetota bacterium]
MHKKITVIPSTYSKSGQLGDFEFMLNQPAYNRTLFIFNDNEEQFDAFVNGESSGFTRGGGNAAIRPFRKLTPPRAAGVPTGKSGRGYSALDQQTKAKIDQSIAVITDLLETGNYDSVVFSANLKKNDIGTDIHEVVPVVTAYIFKQLTNL